MGILLRCRLCGGEHANTPKHFPLVLYNKEHELIGYGCKKCHRKGRREQFIAEHHVRPLPGQWISDAIDKKAAELKLASRAAPAPARKEIKPQGKISKAKTLIKNIFTKRRGRE